MAVSTGCRWVFTVLVLGFSMALAACTGGGGNNAFDADVEDQCAATCAAPDQCCDLGGGRFCIHVETDILNCGACGNHCSAQTANACGGAECKCGLGPECTDGKTCVSDVVGCRDLQSDPQNCGTPGHACGPEETCAGGQCSCGGEVCATGETCCGARCTDLKTDGQNCGECHFLCDGEEDACTNGACSCPGGGHCSPPTYNQVGLCCGTGCSNVCTDEQNCGACGHACAAGVLCDLGGCAGETTHLEACSVLP